MLLWSYARVSRDDPPGVERLEIQHQDNRTKIEELGAECAGELEDEWCRRVAVEDGSVTRR